jgi:cobalamin biosynthesis protein CobD/CbiB
MDWAFVLVIILSVFLALFLVLGIVLVILLIKVTLQIKRVTKSAEKTAVNLESIVGNVSKFSSPMLVGRMIMKKFKKGKE